MAKGKRKPKLESSEELQGNGGLAEALRCIEANSKEILFLGLRVVTEDNAGSTRDKYVVVKFISQQCSPMLRGGVTGYGSKTVAAFQPQAKFYDCDETNYKDTLTGKEIASALLKIGGAHKPSRYVFGTDAVIDVAELG